MKRLPTLTLVCPSCTSLLALRGDVQAPGETPEIEVTVIEAARELALARHDPIGAAAALEALKSAADALLSHEIEGAPGVPMLMREIRDWLPTLSETECMVFGVVSLRGALRRDPLPSFRTLKDAHEGAVSAVADFRREVKRLEYGAERDDWIRAHGSPRLKLILAEGYASGSDAAYRDERLRRDRPGWGWLEPGGKRLGTLSEPRNPPTTAFAVLEEARKLDEGARLKYLDQRRQGRRQGRRYVAVSLFLGRQIVYPRLDC